MLPAGDYRHLVTVLAETVDPSPTTGAQRLRWSEQVPNLFAKVESLGGNEQQKATGQVLVGQYTVSMRYRQDITSKNRLRWEDTGITLSITGITLRPEANEIEFTCASVQ